MLARIWWKEGRTMAPVAAILAVVLVALQWFLLAYGGGEVRRGGTVSLALGWAVLYALVAGAASFAGERELRMMGFLDALPVGRGMLWLGKTSFVLASSLLVGVAFWGVGWIGSDGVVRPGQAAMRDVVRFATVVLVEAAVWGLLWSAIARNAITAGVLAVITTTVSISFLAPPLAYQPVDMQGLLTAPQATTRVLLMALALAVSWLAVRWEQVAWMIRGRELATAAHSAAVPAIEGRRRSRSLVPSAAFWSVAWQTAREGRATWLQATGLLLVVPLSDALLVGPDRQALGFLLVLVVFLAALILGTSVFGLENSTGTRQFLDIQAVSPRTVWLAKVGTWGAGVLVAAGLLILASMAGDAVTGRSGPLETVARSRVAVPMFVAGPANVVLVGLIAGMIFSRRITATLIAGLAAVAVVAPQAVMVGTGIIPAWGLTLTPLILLGISFLWAGDWLAVRGSWRRWARLATLAAVPTVVLAGWFIAGRAYGIPDIGPQFVTVTQPAHGGLLRDEYLAAADVLPPSWADQFDMAIAAAIDRGWPGASPELVATLQANRATVDEARRLAAAPGAITAVDQPPPGEADAIITLGEDRPLARGMRTLAALLALDAAERRSRGDLSGAWEDILAQYRMGDQFAAGSSTLLDYHAAMGLADSAHRQALAWAREPALTRDAARAARLTIQQLSLPGIATVLRAESGRLETALDQPTERWVDTVTLSPRGGLRADDQSDDITRGMYRMVVAWGIAPAWERERTRRILRQITRMAVRYSENGVFERGAYAPFWPQRAPLGGPVAMNRSPLYPPVAGVAGREEVFAITPLADQVTEWIINAERDYDRALAQRGLIDTFLALRAWQIGHGGAAPATLAEIVPAELELEPDDPFQLVPRSEKLLYARAPIVRDGHVVRDEPGPYYYLSSVGPDGMPARLPMIDAPSLTHEGTLQDDLFAVLPATIPPPTSPTPAPPP